MAIKLSDDTRKRLISSVRRYFEENMDEAVGDLKATLLLEFFLEELGPSTTPRPPTRPRICKPG